jgi:hypothetical protein
MLWTLVLTNLIVGILMMIVSLPMIDNKIKPNRYYGFRVKKTLENPEIWYKVNEYSGKRMFVVGMVISLGSMGISLIPKITPQQYGLITGMVNIFLLTLVVVLSVNYLNSL